MSTLLDLDRGQIVVPALVTAFAWAVKTVFGFHQWRGQNRREFLEIWKSGDKSDDLWVEVVVRHLTGTYLPAKVIRALGAAPGRAEALLEMSAAWPLLRLDESTGRIIWKNPNHRKRQQRRRRWRASNTGYFLCSYACVLSGMLASSLSATVGGAWIYGTISVMAGLSALRLLWKADELKSADAVAPSLIRLVNGHQVNNQPFALRSVLRTPERDRHVQP